jgi:hypothetical protein
VAVFVSDSENHLRRAPEIEKIGDQIYNLSIEGKEWLAILVQNAKNVASWATLFVDPNIVPY